MDEHRNSEGRPVGAAGLRDDAAVLVKALEGTPSPRLPEILGDLVRGFVIEGNPIRGALIPLVLRSLDQERLPAIEAIFGALHAIAPAPPLEPSGDGPAADPESRARWEHLRELAGSIAEERPDHADEGWSALRALIAADRMIRAAAKPKPEGLDRDELRSKFSRWAMDRAIGREGDLPAWSALREDAFPLALRDALSSGRSRELADLITKARDAAPDHRGPLRLGMILAISRQSAAAIRSGPAKARGSTAEESVR
jgi:hypothetical protein